MMARSRLRHEWDQTSLLWATLANANRDAKKRPKPFSPYDVHPISERPAPTNDEGNFELLKLLTMDNDGSRRNKSR